MTYTSEVLADSPLAFYRFEEGSGSVLVDSSGNGRNGSYIGSPSLAAPGIVGSSVTFDGTARAASVPAASWMGVAALTLEAWVKFSSAAIMSVLDRDAGGGRIWQFRVNNGRPEFIKILGGVQSVGSSGPALNDGLWHHIAFTFDGTTGRLYADGTQVGSGALGSFTNATVQFDIGRNGSAGGGFAQLFVGQIDEVAYYGTALSGSRLTAHHAAATGSSGGGGATSKTAPGRAQALSLTLAAGAPRISARRRAGQAQSMSLAAPPGAGELPSVPGASLIGAGQPQALALQMLAGSGSVPEPLVLSIDNPELETTPTLIDVTLLGADPETDVVFTVPGLPAQTIESDTAGELYMTSLQIGALPAGVHTLTATNAGRVGTFGFLVLEDSDEGLDDPPEIDEEPVAVPGSTGVQKWVLQDITPGGLGSWQMPINPTTNAGPIVQRNLSPGRTTYPGGRHHITGGAPVAMSWRLAGYVADKAQYDALVAYGQLNRRFFLIDHRDRAWKATFESVALTPRKRQAADDGTFNDWAHDYEITALIFSEQWRSLT